MGKGDPKAFNTFFKSRGVSLKMFPRYVGNRLHILFHLSGTYFYMKENVGEFLDKFCAARGGRLLHC